MRGHGSVKALAGCAPISSTPVQTPATPSCRNANLQSALRRPPDCRACPASQHYGTHSTQLDTISSIRTCWRPPTCPHQGEWYCPACSSPAGWPFCSRLCLAYKQYILLVLHHSRLTPVLDLCSHSHKGLLHIGGIFGACLQEGDANFCRKRLRAELRCKL